MAKFSSSIRCVIRRNVIFELGGKTSVLVSVLFVFLITGVSSRTPPHIIEASDDSISIPKSNTLTLTCRGEYPVKWQIQQLPSNTRKRAEEQISHNENGAYAYHATIKVPNTVYTDTGKYTCVYSDTVDSESLENKSDIYVYINDPDNLLLPCAESNVPLCFISSQQSKETIIPCRPTSLDVSVALWKGSPDKPSSSQVEVNGMDVVYHPTKGFSIYFATAYYSDEFYCKAILGEKSKQLNFHLQWFPSTYFVPSPTIHYPTKYASLYSDFYLTCSVIADPNVFLNLSWKYPDIGSYRVNVGNETYKVISSDKGNYRETQRKLSIKPVQLVDQGTYTCTVTDHNSKTNHQSMFVEVRDIDSAFIKFRLEGMEDENAIAVPVGYHEVKFVVTVDAFPSKPILFWSKNNQILTDSNKYHIMTKDKESTLVIYDLDRNDNGEYFLNGTTANASGYISIRLFVTESPDVKIQPFPKVIRASEIFNITCHVQGCPADIITWEWKKCPQPGRCDKDYQIMNGSDANIEQLTEHASIENGCNYWTVLSGNATVSGYYRCSALNEHGSNSSEVPMFISDYKDAFNIVDHPKTLFEQDNLTLQCYASLFYFSNIEWSVIYSNRRSKIVTNTSNVLVITRKTNYSMVSTININPVVMENAGTYVCRATLLGSGTKWEAANSTIFVTKPRPPQIVETNLNSTEYKVEKEGNFEFICRARGLPLPNITWYLNGTKIEVSNHSAMQFEENGAKLSISRVLSSDSGRYVCQIANRAGYLLLNATLVVLDSAKAPLSVGALAGIGVVVVLFIIAVSVIGIALGRRLCRERKERQELEQLEYMLFNKGDLGSYNPALPLEEQIDYLPYDNQWEFPKEKLKLGRTIGQGAFGRVVRAEATGIYSPDEVTPVAVKMLKEHANWEQRKALMQELKIMIHLGSNLNVVNLLGAVTKNLGKGELQVIVEYCRFGNMRHYLLRHRENFINQIHPETGEIDHSLRQKPSEGAFLGRSSRCSEQISSGISCADSTVFSNGSITPTSPPWDSGGQPDNNRLSIGAAKCAAAQTLTTYHLLGYAYQICSGMQYLVTRKLVHRDLALRNILLADGDIVKICDFGLTKDVYKKEYYRKKGKGALPIKWMAVESIRDRVFSTESDIWSFGIVLWEMFTLGANPYPGLEIDEEFFRKLSNGYRMEKPPLSTESMYALMLECWRHEPKTRPSFDEISQRIGEMLDKSTIKHYRELNDDYLQPIKTVHNPNYLNMMANKSDYINVDESGKPLGKSEYVKSDKPLALNTKSGAVNYVNMPSPVEQSESNDRAFKYGDLRPTNHEKEPMLYSPSSDHFFTSPTLKLEPSTPSSQSTNPFLSSTSTNTNPFLTDLPPDPQDGYLDMGSKLNLDTDAVVSLRNDNNSPSCQKGSPPPRYTTVITNDDLYR